MSPTIKTKNPSKNRSGQIVCTVILLICVIFFLGGFAPPRLGIINNPKTKPHSKNRSGQKQLSHALKSIGVKSHPLSLLVKGESQINNGVNFLFTVTLTLCHCENCNQFEAICKLQQSTPTLTTWSLTLRQWSVTLTPWSLTLTSLNATLTTSTLSLQQLNPTLTI